MRNNYWLDGMMGLVVGDALGVPVQFMTPEAIASRTQGIVTGMEGGGTYNMPEGCWSDDSSMAIATLYSINIKNKLDPGDVMINFVRWLYKGEFTPFGEAFDEGNTCVKAISNFTESSNPFTCGVTGEYANGNGALMRILPACLYNYDLQKKTDTSDEKAIQSIHQIGALTHNHLRSNIACGLYYFMVKAIIDNKNDWTLQKCLQGGIEEGREFYASDIKNLTELSHYGRLFDLEEFKKISDSKIKFGGYVVDALEAAVWSLLQTDSFKECLLRIVNYGDDSDTVAAIAGGLAGIYYGHDSIPKTWLDAIINKSWIEQTALFNFTPESPVVDLHCHMVPKVDDGAKDFDMAMEMIRMSYSQGVRDIFMTSHSCGMLERDIQRYQSGFDILKAICAVEMPDLRLHVGAEVLCEYGAMDEIINDLNNKLYFTLNESRYVLVEFYDRDKGTDGAKYCLQKLIDAGYIPIIAHTERYSEMLSGGIDDVKELKAAGCFVQINLYSVAEEKDRTRAGFAHELLREKLVDFVGSDAHRTTHRPPRISAGVEALYEIYDSDYVDAILYKNADKIFGLTRKQGDKMTDRRAKNAEIFNDTRAMINENNSLQEAVKYSVASQKLFLEDVENDFEIKNIKRNSCCNIIVSGKRTFEAAEKYAKSGKRVAVLNFASATNPGGGVVKGSSAQEEALCRCSTLYPCLDNDAMFTQFYNPHRQANNPLYNDDILYTPDVFVIKSDVNFPERLQKKDWYKVDVITCAAPNLRHVPSNEMNPNSGSKAANVSPESYTEIMRNRIHQIFKVALTTGDEVLILGAFGCGAFCNPPEIVAGLFKEAVDEFNNYFETIEFAVFYTDRETANYNEFKKAFTPSNIHS